MLNMRITLSFLLVVSVAPAYAEPAGDEAKHQYHYDNNNPPLMFGVGGTSCGAYLDATNNPADLAIYDAFLSGYATSVGMSYGGNILSSTDYPGIKHWLINYCQSNPTHNYAVAVGNLISEEAGKYLRGRE